MVTAATRSDWRDSFPKCGTAAIKILPSDDGDEEIARLRSKVGQHAMDNELLGRSCQHLETGHLFATRRRGS